MSPGMDPEAERVVRPAVSVDELKRAWYAVQAGDFRRRTSHRTRHRARQLDPHPDFASAVDEPMGQLWMPAAGERVLPVVGVAGSVGASTVALAVATAATGPVRVVECCPPTASGLAAATTAELGVTETGWRQGRRDPVLIERTDVAVRSVEELPRPTSAEHVDQLTILDAGWDTTPLAAGTGWLTSVVRNAPVVVVVTTATVPGFRRLEAALELLDFGPARVAAAVVGPVHRRWPRGVEQSAGPAVRHLLAAGRVVEIPHDRGLAVNGIDSRPLPEAVTAAAARLLSLALSASGPVI